MNQKETQEKLKGWTNKTIGAVGTVDEVYTADAVEAAETAETPKLWEMSKEDDSMLKKFYKNALAKKTSIFAVVFALTCILMGNGLRSMDEREGLASILPGPSGQAAAVVPVSLDLPLSSLPAAHTDEEDFEEAMEAFLTFGENFNSESPSPLASPLPLQDEETPVPPSTLLNVATPDGFVYSPDIPLREDLQKYTYSLCVERGLEYELVLALMWRESRFTIDAVGYNQNGTKDSGIMQINDVNRAWLLEKHGISDLLDPVQNIDAGTIMLSGFISKYGVNDGLMAYQYGEAGMRRKLASGVSTNNQISILLSKRDDYRTLFEKA